MNASNTVGTFEAKTHLSELLERVAEGESFVITRRGQAIARLVPAGPTVVPLKVEVIVAGARALRAAVRAGDTEIRSWIDEGRS